MTSKESQQTKLSELSETDRFKAELATLLLYRAGFVELYGKIAGRHPDQINVSKKLLRTEDGELLGVRWQFSWAQDEDGLAKGFYVNMTAEGALEIDANTDNRDPIRVNLENWGDEERKELEDRLKSAFSSPWFVKQGDF